MLFVVRECILKEACAGTFLSIQADETTGISTQFQLVLLLRYIYGKNNVPKRLHPPSVSDPLQSIATALKECLTQERYMWTSSMPGYREEHRFGPHH